MLCGDRNTFFVVYAVMNYVCVGMWQDIYSEFVVLLQWQRFHTLPAFLWRVGRYKNKNKCEV